MTDGRPLDETLHPEPFTRVMRLMREESDWYRRAWRTIDVLEWAVKWEVAVVLGYLLDRHSMPPDLRLRLAESLSRPSLGVWIDYLRRGLAAVPDQRLRDWDLVLRLEREHRFVAFRNDYAHGAVERDDQARARCVEFEPVAERLAATPYLAGTALIVVSDEAVRTLGGPVRPPFPHDDRPPPGTYAWVPAIEELVLLWPFAAHLPAAGDRPEGLYFHNALRQHRVESLNYDIPARRRDATLFERFHERAPLTEWAGLTTLEPLEAIGLRDDVIGRDDVVQGLADAVGEITEQALIGPPGQGKSAVMASLAAWIRAGAGAPIVIERYLRRGDHRSEPAHVLWALAERLASTMQEHLDQSSAGTLARAAELLQVLLDRWHASGQGPLVIMIDGLDEQPELLGALPRPGGDVRLIWSARPTERVRSTLVDRAIPASAVTRLDRLDEGSALAILYRGVDKLDPRLDRNYVRAVLARSDGNPLFLVTLSDHLFDRPALVGNLEVLPPDLADLFEQVVARAVERDDPRATLAVLRLLAIAHDLLTETEIAVILGLDTYEVGRALRALDELAVGRRDARTSQYTLFHESLREWVQLRHAVETARLEATVARRAATAPMAEPEAQGYLLRHGIDHVCAVVDAGGTESASLVSALVSWTSANMRSFLLELSPHRLVDTVARIEDLAQRVGLSSGSLAPALLELARRRGDAPPAVTEGALHDVLTYRRERSFTDAFYGRIEEDWSPDDPDRLRLGVLAAGRLRRRGSDVHRRRAHRLLEPFRVESPLALTLDLQVQSRAWYELGYLAHLEDDPAQAILAVERAAVRAAGAETPTRHWTAMCVATRIRWLGGTATAEEFLEVLTEADEAFHTYAETDPAAVRWRMNVTAHRLEVALRQADLDTAGALIERLESDPWLAAFGYLDGLEVDRDRLAILDGRAGKVVEGVVARADRMRTEEPHAEAIADLDLDAARALRDIGDETRARQYAQRGLATPSGQAAWYARPELAAFLRT